MSSDRRLFRPTRRGFLEILGAAGAGYVLQSALMPAFARAADGPDPLLLVCYFNGGWDQLLALDPRDNRLPQFNDRAQAQAKDGSGIYPGYHLIEDLALQRPLSEPGYSTAGALTFGPAIPQSLLDHAADLSLVRGMTMETLTHEVGRRYFITGKMPRGLSPNGSALTSLVAHQTQSARDIPNLSVNTESYSEGLPAFASPIRVSNFNDAQNVLRALGTALPTYSSEAISRFEARGSCAQDVLDFQSKVSRFKDSRVKALELVTSGKAGYFDFDAPAASRDPSLDRLYGYLGIDPTRFSDLTGPKGRAAIAAQALAHGISQAVSVELASGMDDHFDWAETHATTLNGGFDLLGRLIRFLKETPLAGSEESVWSRTTLLVFSEFARTPLLNGREGRDHHICNSCLVAGPNVRGNLVVGRSSDKGAMPVAWDPILNREDAGGVLMRPVDVHHTLLQSMGLSTAHLDNQNPHPISALIKSS